MRVRPDGIPVAKGISQQLWGFLLTRSIRSIRRPLSWYGHLLVVLCSSSLFGSPIMSGPEIFLSYNSADRQAVIAIQRLLRARGITTFLDRDNLVSGLPWPQALEEALRSVRGVAVFIGRELGGWQKREDVVCPRPAGA
jgi:hypothetical protein